MIDIRDPNLSNKIYVLDVTEESNKLTIFIQDLLSGYKGNYFDYQDDFNRIFRQTFEEIFLYMGNDLSDYVLKLISLPDLRYYPTKINENLDSFIELFKELAISVFNKVKTVINYNSYNVNYIVNNIANGNIFLTIIPD